MPEGLDRREFLKYAAVTGGALVLSGCAKKIENITNTITPTPTGTKEPTKTQEPTKTPTPEPTKQTYENWQNKHELERISKLEKYGPARTIPAFEYHSDNYGMGSSGGKAIDMTPQSFEEQMKWLHDNDFHAVTGDELKQYIHDETYNLPARSIILTFDMGNPESCGPEPVERITNVFNKYNMHGIFTIWTIQMDDDPSRGFCTNNSCWDAYKKATTLGVATMGTHTNSHRDFATLSSREGLRELALSKQKIEEKTNSKCEVLTWPYESIPEWAKSIDNIGIYTAFGGNTYTMKENAVHKTDTNWYNLPRILPPSTDGYSTRPYGEDMDGIMSMYITDYN
jgi:peptidoglycan/xylan/chitin deacetylase (PgdA/CDA1 family)